MIIYLNSEQIKLDAVMTLQQLLEQNKLIIGSFAIAINRQFIPRSLYLTTNLNDGDEIDIVTPMQGG